MRLLTFDDREKVTLTKKLFDDGIPPYAILSHTWGEDEDEVSFDDMVKGTFKRKCIGFRKIQFCIEQARADKISHFWIDTCCIDKASSSELSEAIQSMFHWYREAVKCYVYLSDVGGPDLSSLHHARPLFCSSRWFTRGWTLQELLAPKVVEFYSNRGQYLGDKSYLEADIKFATGIPVEALRGSPLSDFSVEERMSWAAKRETKRREDKAYCLLGIFDVNMPLLYGERDKALTRLWEEIQKASGHKTTKPYGTQQRSNTRTHTGSATFSAPRLTPDASATAPLRHLGESADDLTTAGASADTSFFSSLPTWLSDLQWLIDRLKVEDSGVYFQGRGEPYGKEQAVLRFEHIYNWVCSKIHKEPDFVSFLSMNPVWKDRYIQLSNNLTALVPLIVEQVQAFSITRWKQMKDQEAEQDRKSPSLNVADSSEKVLRRRLAKMTDQLEQIRKWQLASPQELVSHLQTELATNRRRLHMPGAREGSGFGSEKAKQGVKTSYQATHARLNETPPDQRYAIPWDHAYTSQHGGQHGFTQTTVYRDRHRNVHPDRK